MEKKNKFSKYALKWVLGLGLAAGLMVGCKDYDDDINALKDRVAAVEKSITDIKAQISTGKTVMSIAPISGSNPAAQRITLSDGTTYDFPVVGSSSSNPWTIGADGYWYNNGTKTTNKAVPTAWTIGADGYWYADGAKTTTKAAGTTISIVDGEWAIDGVKTGLPASGATLVPRADNSGSDLTIITYAADGTKTTNTIFISKSGGAGAGSAVASVVFLPEYIDFTANDLVPYGYFDYYTLDADLNPAATYVGAPQLAFKVNPTNLVYGTDFSIKDISVLEVRARGEALEFTPEKVDYDPATGILIVSITANDPTLIKAAPGMLRQKIALNLQGADETSVVTSNSVLIAPYAGEVSGDLVNPNGNADATMMAYDSKDDAAGKPLVSVNAWGTAASAAAADNTRKALFPAPSFYYYINDEAGNPVSQIDMKEHIEAFFIWAMSLNDLGLPVSYKFTPVAKFQPGSVDQQPYMSLTADGILKYAIPSGKTIADVLGKTPAFRVDASMPDGTVIASGFAMIEFADAPQGNSLALTPNPLPIEIKTVNSAKDFEQKLSDVFALIGAANLAEFQAAGYTELVSAVVNGKGTVITITDAAGLPNANVTMTLPAAAATKFSATALPVAAKGVYNVKVEYFAQYKPTLTLTGRVQVNYPAVTLRKDPDFWNAALNQIKVYGLANPTEWAMQGNLLSGFNPNDIAAIPDVYTNFAWQFCTSDGKLWAASATPATQVLPIGISALLTWATPRDPNSPVNIALTNDAIGRGRINGRIPYEAGTPDPKAAAIWVKLVAKVNGAADVTLVDPFEVYFAAPIKPVVSGNEMKIKDQSGEYINLTNGFNIQDFMGNNLMEYTIIPASDPEAVDFHAGATLLTGVSFYGNAPADVADIFVLDLAAATYTTDYTPAAGAGTLSIVNATGVATWTQGQGIPLTQPKTIKVTAKIPYKWNTGMVDGSTAALKPATNGDVQITFNLVVDKTVQ